MLGKESTEEGAKNGSKRPSSLDDTVPFGAVAEGHDVGEDHHAHSDYAAAPDSLDAPSDKESTEVVRNASNDGADGEEGDGRD